MTSQIMKEHPKYLTLFSTRVLQPHSYPFVLSAVVPREDVTILTSSFDVVDEKQVSESARPEIRSEDSRRMLKIFILVVDEIKLNRILSTLSQLYGDSEYGTVVDIDDFKTNKLHKSRERLRILPPESLEIVRQSERAGQQKEKRLKRNNTALLQDLLVSAI